MADETPYLDAIQAVPGDTIGEKFRWIAKLIKERLAERNSLEHVVESEKIPKPLVPLVQVEAAMMLMKRNPEDQSAYGAIAEALKSQDEFIVNRALKANGFFNGSNKTFTNVNYFFDNLLEHVSLNTRTRIIKNLAANLAPNNSELAEEFFVTITAIYSLKQALPLLPACSESFVYNCIVDGSIVLSRKLVKQIFRKNPDFVVRCLRLSKPNTDPCVRNPHPVNIYDFGDFLAALIKKRLDSFVELYEMHEKLPPSITLSNRCAEAFLKNGKEHLQRNPRLYIKILPLKMISNSRMEAIFPKLFPDNAKEFKTDSMLDYLKYYPRDKKAELLLRSYRANYGKSLLDDPSKVTVPLLMILPAVERVRQARIKLEHEQPPCHSFDYTTSWICYLPTAESIPQLRDEMAKTSEMEFRATIACKMIYSCKVNNDDQALLEVLTYLRDRHKNEQSWFLMKVFETLLSQYELPQMGKDCWTILTDMIMRAHVKKDLPAGNPASARIVEAAIHYNILQNRSIDQLIDVLVDLKSTMCTTSWNILTKYPEYERRCLEACVNAVSQKYDSDKTPWNEDKIDILYYLCSSIYRFNSSHVSKTSRIERMSIKNYPWLLQAVEEILRTGQQSNVYVIENMRSLLKTNEKDLYERFWPKAEEIADVEKGEAFRLLRKNPERILAYWEDYLRCCQDKWYTGQVRRFVRTLRWYKDIPGKFVRQCLRDLTEKKEGSCLYILALLVHGETYVKIIEPLLPADKTIDVHREEAKIDYSLVQHVVDGAKLANPPIPLTILTRLCDGDYLSTALAGLVNTCRRHALTDVITIARALTSSRVSVRKHGIRLMKMVAPRAQLLEFLHSQWNAEENRSIRLVLFSAATDVFLNDPGPATYHLFERMLSTFTVKDDEIYSKFLASIKSISDEYVSFVVTLAFGIVDDFEKAGLDQWRVASYISTLFSSVNAAICNTLAPFFIKDIVRRYLFHDKLNVSRSVAMFVLTVLLHPAKDEFDERMEIFSSVFTEVVKSGWNVAHPKNPRFYPVNNAVHRFVDTVAHTFSYLDMEPRLIEGILSTFLAVLQPQKDAASYLLLVYIREQVSTKMPQEFGRKLGERMPELVEIFSSLFVFFMADTLQHMLQLDTFKDYDKEDATLGVIEGLMEVGSIDATLMAVKLLTPIKTKEYTDRYDKLMTKLSGYDHPVIRSIVCDIINKTSFMD